MRAQHMLGLRGCKRKKIVLAVAEKLGVPFPATKLDQIALLQQFCGVVPAPEKKKRTGPWPTGATDVNSDAFLLGYEWRRLRMVVLTKRGARCECCGATPKDGVRMHVDHIKPRRLFPQLALTESNLQILCEVCNHGKGNWDQTDWRSETVPAVVVPRPRLVKQRTAAVPRVNELVAALGTFTAYE